MLCRWMSTFQPRPGGLRDQFDVVCGVVINTIDGILTYIAGTGLEAFTRLMNLSQFLCFTDIYFEYVFNYIITLDGYRDVLTEETAISSLAGGIASVPDFLALVGGLLAAVSWTRSRSNIKKMINMLSNLKSDTTICKIIFVFFFLSFFFFFLFLKNQLKKY